MATTETRPDLAWMDAAACAQAVRRGQALPEWWSLIGLSNLSTDNIHAQALCDGCPVRRECNAWALDEGITDQICGMPLWALTPQELADCVVCGAEFVRAPRQFKPRQTCDTTCRNMLAKAELVMSCV